ncbi:MAG: transposase [Pirellulales bacterium]|nr:transposase [Pirellulales bacterium]
MTGWILSTRHRYVTDLIVSSDSTNNGHFSNYHRFFSQAVWDIDHLWKLLAQLIVSTLIGPDAIITLAGDDTLCRKRGLGIFGTGMHHDPLSSSKSKKICHWGHDWVDLCIVIANPWWAPSKVFSLPICMRLYRNRQGLAKGKNKKATKKSPGQKKAASQKNKQAAAKRKLAKQAAEKNRQGSKTPHKTRPELMAQMIALVAAWFPDRRFVLVVDSLYSGKSVLSNLPTNFDLIGPVHAKAALYAPAPKETKVRRGPRRKKGDRLKTMEAWEKDSSRWQTHHFDQYGLHGSLQTKTRTGLYYKAGKDRLLRFVLSRDTVGDRPTRIFYSTNADLKARAILSLFSLRWSIEVTHFDSKQHLGLEDAANRSERAVKRTAPMAMFLHSLTIVWYATEGHKGFRVPHRPWYWWKEEPSFADMLTTLRRKSWEEQLAQVSLDPTQRDNKLDLLTYLATLAG